MKRTYILLTFVLLILFTACSKDEAEPSPTDYLSTYVEHWHDMQFEQMYAMLTDETKTTYPPEQFVERYMKIYDDLNITDLSITYDDLAEEELELALEEGTVTLPILVAMDSIAGQIEFDYHVTLEKLHPDKDDSKTEDEWQLIWDPGLIFPPLKDGGEIAIRTTNPKRGEILDRNMMPLAINDFVYEIGIKPGELGDTEEQQKSQIAKILNMSVEAIDKELSAGWVQPDLFVPLKKVPKTAENTLAQLREIKAIRSQEVIGRVYPLGEAAAHLTGYIGSITAEELDEQEPGTYGANDIIGKRGLEQLFEKRLKGEKGIEIVVTSENKEDTVLAEKPVQDGETISLTIDINVQNEIYETYVNEKKAGTAAAINPMTGETLALVSSPAFDPNELLYGISQSKWDKLTNDLQTPLVNRFAATFAPGSVIKPITAAIGLENGTIDPDEGIEIEGYTWDNGSGWGDYQVRRVSLSSEPVDLADALMRSDNIYFAMKSVDMGAEALIDGLHNFGFGDSLPFEYPIVQSTISSSGTLSTEVEVANTSYGQAQLEISALHLASAYTTFLNGGSMIKPTMLLAESDVEVWKEQLISAEHAALIEDILEKVVSDGTGSSAQNAPFAISGKTGTAELKKSIDDEDGKLNGWFVGYPTEDQDILIAMMMEDVDGSSVVAETVADILTKLKQ